MSINILKKLKKQGGFTLLELLIVIVIIGILALLIIPNITSAPKKARDTQRKTDLKAIQKGLEEYYVSNNVYPAGAGGSATTALATPLATGNPAILKAIPTDPNHDSTTPYVYKVSGTGYALEACLENAGDTGASTQAAGNYASNGGGGACATKSFELLNNN